VPLLFLFSSYPTPSLQFSVALPAGTCINHKAICHIDSLVHGTKFFNHCPSTCALHLIMSDDLDLQSLLGVHQTSPQLDSLLEKLSAITALPITRATPDVKSYSDAVYHNFYALGISLMFAPPTKGVKVAPELFVCDSIDVMNVPEAEAGNTRAAKSASTYCAFPGLPLHLPDTPLVLNPTTTGAEFVQHLGEPARKGGGTGTTGPGIWCEWPARGLMVEFGGDEARGPNAWDRGGKAVWSVLTVFRVAE
jgi:hypothetical protein